MADNCHGTRWTSQQPVREINSCNNSALRSMHCVHSLSEQLDFSLPEHLTTTTCWLITWITADWSHNWSQLIMSGAMITWLVGWITWLAWWITWHKLLHELLLTDTTDCVTHTRSSGGPSSASSGDCSSPILLRSQMWSRRSVPLDARMVSLWGDHWTYVREWGRGRGRGEWGKGWNSTGGGQRGFKQRKETGILP